MGGGEGRGGKTGDSLLPSLVIRAEGGRKKTPKQTVWEGKNFFGGGKGKVRTDSWRNKKLSGCTPGGLTRQLRIGKGSLLLAPNREGAKNVRPGEEKRDFFHRLRGRGNSGYRWGGGKGTNATGLLGLKRGGDKSIEEGRKKAVSAETRFANIRGGKKSTETAVWGGGALPKKKGALNLRIGRWASPPLRLPTKRGKRGSAFGYRVKKRARESGRDHSSHEGREEELGIP